MKDLLLAGVVRQHDSEEDGWGTHPIFTETVADAHDIWSKRLRGFCEPGFDPALMNISITYGGHNIIIAQIAFERNRLGRGVRSGSTRRTPLRF